MNFLSLIFRFQGDNSDFKSKVRDNEASVSGMKGKMDSFSSAMSAGLAKGVGALAAVGLGYEGLKAGVKGAIDDAKEFRKLQSETGLPIDQLQRYSKAARKAGEDNGLILHTFEKFKIAISEALEKGPEVFDKGGGLKELGYSFEQLKNTVPAQLYGGLLDEMANGQLTTDQTRAAHEKLGKSFAGLSAVAEELSRKKNILTWGSDEVAGITSFGRAFEGMGGKVKYYAGVALSQIEVLRRVIAKGSLFDAKENALGAVLDIGAEGKKREDAIKAAERAQLDENRRNVEYQAKVKESETHQAIQDRIVTADESATDANEKARQSQLTDEEKINELLEQRRKLKEHLEFFDGKRTDGQGAEVDAEVRKKLADVNLEIANSAKGSGKYEKPDLDSLSRTGIYVGGKRDPLVDINTKSLTMLTGIKAALDEIKRQKPKDLFQ